VKGYNVKYRARPASVSLNSFESAKLAEPLRTKRPGERLLLNCKQKLGRTLRFIDSDWRFSFEQRLRLSSRGLERREIIEGEISTSAKYRILL